MNPVSCRVRFSVTATSTPSCGSSESWNPAQFRADVESGIAGCSQELLRTLTAANHELLEERLIEHQLHAGNRLQLFGQ